MALGGETRQTWSPVVLPRATVALGLLGLIVLAYLLVTNGQLVEGVLPGQLLEGLLIGVPAIGLIYAGYWLHTGWFTPSQHWKIGMFGVFGTITATTITGLAIALSPIESLSPAQMFYLYVSTGTEGALLGILVGIFAVTDLLRRRGQELAIRSDRLRYVERVADIGFWEIEPATEPPYPVRVSAGWSRIHGIAPDDGFTLEDVLDAYHPEDRDRLRTSIEQAIKEGDRFDIEARLAVDDTAEHWIRFIGEPSSSGGSAQPVHGVAQVITDRKSYEQELERQNKRLQEFASLVSHDLRNPLNVAAGRLDLARQEVENENLEAVDKALERMSGLIKDLLALARKGQTIDELEDIDLAVLWKSAWSTVQTHDAEYTVQTDRTIRADEARLQQLFENVIRNAIEHGGPDVTIRIGELADGFYIEDDGPGIPVDEREDVLQPGYTTSEEGTGYGLSIVSEIAEAHGWKLTISEGETGGARLELTNVDVIEQRTGPTDS